MDIPANLALFLENNPHSEWKDADDGFRIERPWGDESVALEAKGDEAALLADALEHLVLPARFAAIYHRDDSAAEFIWTLAPVDHRLIGRTFSFCLPDQGVHCEWRQASDRLLTIVRNSKPAGPPTSTDYRNLLFLHRFQTSDLDSRLAAEVKDLKPISFWCTRVPSFDDESMVRLAKHLNFFMKYYDRDSPSILIHRSEQPETPVVVLPLLRSEFPGELRAREIDQLLLDFALAADEVVETRLKFIYYYQIIEHAAFYSIGDTAKRDVLAVLRSPDVQVNCEAYVDRVLDALADTRIADEQKSEKVIQDRASPDRIWREIEANRSYFVASHTFEVGFHLEPLISEDTSLDAFKAMWGTKIPSVLRWLRNALVHGRESRTSAIIAPTLSNNRLIRPWIPVIRRIAEDIIIYEE